MRAVWLYRIAAVVLVLFAALHTFGFLNFVPPTAEGKAVWEGMQRVHFTLKGAEMSYGGFYVGFGLFATAFMLFCAYLCWHLSNQAAGSSAGSLSWVLFASQIASLVLSWAYFSSGPAMFSAVSALCIGGAALSKRG